MQRLSGRLVPRAHVAGTIGLAMIAAGSPYARAQTPSLDPRTLQALQATLGSGSGVPGAAATQLDASRSAAASDARARYADRQDVTVEELAVRRERSLNELSTIAPTSPIEREYQQRLGDPTLRQFGYDLFRTAPTGGPLTGAIGGDYLLGIGDELIVTFQGATGGTQTARVDREGRLVVGQLPPIRAAGRSLSAVRAELAASTRRTLLGTEVNATVGAVRSISVFVGGEVGSPGGYQLTSLADIAAAVSQAGGVRRTGSLRHVRVVRAGGSFEIDLYGLLGIGVPSSVRLHEGDRIIVPVLGPTVAIAGGVSRPGIYELRGPASVGQLLDYAGGAVRPRGGRVSISRIEADGSEIFLRGTNIGTRLIAGDAVQVIGGSAGGAIGRVLLRGYVLNPGPRPLVAAPTMRDLVGEVQDLRPETYLPMAIVLRADRATGARRFVPVDLAAALTGRAPFVLRGEDRVYVLSQADISFINRVAVRSIVLGRPNPLPGCRPLERLEALVRDTQSARYNVVTRGTYTTATGQIAGVAAAFAQRSSLSADQQASGQQRSAQQAAALQAAALQGSRAGLDPSRAGYDSTRPGFETTRDVTTSYAGATTRSSDMLEDNVSCPAVFQEEPELLPVLIENAVSVGGAVRRPGAYPIAGPTDAATLATVAEGLLARGEGLVLDVTRAEGAVNRTDRLPALADGRLPAVLVRAGDDIRFNAGQAQFEPGAVLLTGEVARPGLYTIKRGEKLSELFARAGGQTSLSYPYGTIFTRRSVREQQAEGLKRTVREINEGLIIASVRSSGSSSGGNSTEGLAAATQLAASLATVDPVGRVVVEADTRVLTRRPDLDTVLEAGDTVFVPKTPGFVLALGEIGSPGALQFIPGKTVDSYIGESGGYRRTSDVSHSFVVLPNGASEPTNRASFGRKTRVAPPPGSTIIVPLNASKFLGLSTARDIATIVGQFVSTVATVAILARGR